MSIIKCFFIAKKFSPDLVIGRASPVIAFTSFLIQRPYISFSDTEGAKLIAKFAYPFARFILTPESYYLDLGEKQIKYAGNHELAYLHPSRFQPDYSKIEKFGLDNSEPIIFVRFVSWSATHDSGHKGMTDSYKVELVKELSKHGRVIVNSENDIVDEEIRQYCHSFPPEDVHHIFAYTHLFIGESATMASECAILGIPSIYVSTIRSGITNEENECGILFQFENENGVLEKAIDLIYNQKERDEIKTKHQNFLNSHIDVTEYMMNFIEKFPF